MFGYELLFLLSVAFYLLYKWATLYNKTFEERGIPYERPWPLVGNNIDIVLGRESMFSSVYKVYNKAKKHKVYGFFSFRLPVFMINDPSLIKKIAIKDFDHFPNHTDFFQMDNEKLVNSMLSVMKDQRWKDMRNTLTPIFTSAKMRSMFALMNEEFEKTLRYIRNLPRTDGTAVDLELKQCFTRLSNDLIASTAFGLKIDSYENTKNEFYTIGQAITAFRGTQMLKFLLFSVAPKLTKLLNIRVFDPSIIAYFVHLVVDTIKYREQHNIVRPDMIQLIIEVKKESQKWSDTELVAQCFVFFFAAFENNANFICTTCHELMLNPDVQERLYEEVVEVSTRLNGAPLGYDDISKMKYMDMVLSESLRLWSLAAFTDRMCAKDYVLKDDDDNIVAELKAGDRVWFNISGMHRDEKYFENPNSFDPERFSDENKHLIQPFTYIPFGVGPRICIGNRYALLQAKALLYYLLLEYKLERSPKTVKDLMADIRGFQINPEHGFWVKLVPRK